MVEFLHTASRSKKTASLVHNANVCSSRAAISAYEFNELLDCGREEYFDDFEFAETATPIGKYYFVFIVRSLILYFLMQVLWDFTSQTLPLVGLWSSLWMIPSGSQILPLMRVVFSTQGDIGSRTTEVRDMLCT